MTPSPFTVIIIVITAGGWVQSGDAQDDGDIVQAEHVESGLGPGEPGPGVGVQAVEVAGEEEEAGVIAGEGEADAALGQGGGPGSGQHAQAEAHPVQGDDLLTHAVHGAAQRAGDNRALCWIAFHKISILVGQCKVLVQVIHLIHITIKYSA